jgi:hypothetical protein
MLLALPFETLEEREGVEGGGGDGIESVGCAAVNTQQDTNTVHQNAAQPNPQIL